MSLCRPLKQTILDVFNDSYPYATIEYDDSLTVSGLADAPRIRSGDSFRITAPANVDIKLTVYDSEHHDGATSTYSSSQSLTVLHCFKLVATAVTGSRSSTMVLSITPSVYSITGVFQAISSIYNPDYDLTYTDMDYILNHSSNRLCSPLLQRLATDNTAHDDHHYSLTPAQILMLAKMLYAKYSASWDKEYAVLTKSYEPLENYNRTEVETPDITRSRSNNIDSTETEARASKITSSITDATNENDVYGFNSTTAVPESKQTQNTETVTEGSGDDNRTETILDHDQEESETETGTRTTEVSGNIGVMSSQDMLMQELKVRADNQMQEILMRDADRFLAQPYFGDIISSDILR